jgi:hypothetical protein
MLPAPRSHRRLIPMSFGLFGLLGVSHAVLPVPASGCNFPAMSQFIPLSIRQAYFSPIVKPVNAVNMLEIVSSANELSHRRLMQEK